MITKNFKTILATLLQKLSATKALLPIVGRDGDTYYNTIASTTNNFPLSNPSTTLQLSVSGNGILLGTDGTTPTENDHDLKSQITSGISAAVTSEQDVDSANNPYLKFTMVVNNNTSSDITIREIGYAQNVTVTTKKGTQSTTATSVLIDRTVLSTPITVPANGSAGIVYTLKTVMPT